MTEAQRELPRYQCHKRVGALKIKAIDACMITPAEEGYAPFEVPRAYLAKHQPQLGGYYVVYDDGYQSFSPAEVFEQGYTRILSLTTPRKLYIQQETMKS